MIVFPRISIVVWRNAHLQWGTSLHFEAQNGRVGGLYKIVTFVTPGNRGKSGAVRPGIHVEGEYSRFELASGKYCPVAQFGA